MRGLRFGGLTLAIMLGTSGAQAQAQDRDADWIRKPSASDLMGVWPRQALKDGLGGRAVIACIVTVQGTLRACRVESQAPEGIGFGGAALTLASQFLMKPALRGGTPVESQVRIPINFPKPDKALGSFISPGTDGPFFKGDKVYSRLPYLAAPTYADVLAAYPAKAKAAHKGGAATLNCKIGDDGHLGGCNVVRQEPMDGGFGAAARGLASKFIVPTKDRQGDSMAGARTLVLVTFSPDSVDGGPAIGQPRWTALPKASDLAAVMPPAARQAGVLQARVVIRCTVGAAGGLEGCAPATEEPAGVGYGEAALALSKYFRLAIWTEEGLPTIGGTVRVPIRFDFTPKPAAAATP